MPKGCRHLLRSWLAATSILFGAFSPALAADSAEPSAAALIEALVTRVPPIGGPFNLIDHTGRRRTDVDFHGKLVVIYFGYTHCPDVCPTELQTISLALDALGTAADPVQPLFITVDPERDTPSVLADGYAIDHTSFIYLVGKDGRYIDFLPPGLTPERIIEALRLHLDRQSGP